MEGDLRHHQRVRPVRAHRPSRTRRSTEHVHAAVEECFYVLDGAFRFKVGADVVLAEAGAFLFVPRGTAHTWTNALDEPSTMLLTFVPGGMKAFFDEAAPLMHAAPLDLTALTEVNARHATTVVGPPLPHGPLPAA